MLVGEDLIYIDFFAVRSGEEVDRAEAVGDSMMDHQQVNPLGKWWKGSRINSQTGQAIAAEERPDGFKIHKRFSFQSWEEFATIHYHNLTHELEGMEAKGHVLTSVRFATFPGGGEQLYYAHLDAPTDTHFREGANVSMKLLGPEAEDEVEWDFKVVESFGWTHATQYTGFAYRPRVAKGFQRTPEFIEGVHAIDTTEHLDSARRPGPCRVRG